MGTEETHSLPSMRVDVGYSLTDLLTVLGYLSTCVSDGVVLRNIKVQLSRSFGADAVHSWKL